jgi:hypothetical protein
MKRHWLKRLTFPPRGPCSRYRDREAVPLWRAMIVLPCLTLSMGGAVAATEVHFSLDSEYVTSASCGPCGVGDVFLPARTRSNGMTGMTAETGSLPCL